jgi:hypothetical protein
MPVNPYAGSILDILQRSGQQQGDAVRRSGEISGQMYGSIGQIAQGTGQQLARDIAAAPILKQEAELRGLQVKDAERRDLDASRERSTKSAMDILLQGALTKDPATGLTTYDRNKLQAGMAELGVASELPKYLPILDAQDKAIQQAKALHVDALKHSAQIVEMAGNDPDVFAKEIQRGITNGLFTSAEAQPYLDAAKKDPTHIGRITAGMLGRDPNAGQFTLNPGDVRYGADGQQVVANPKPPDTPSMQSKDVLLDGHPALVSFNPKTGTYHDPTGADVTARVRPMPPASVQIHNAGTPTFAGDFDKTGEDFLKTIPAQWRTTVKKIANYDEDPSRVASMRGGNREQLMAWVNQVNPAYDASTFTNRAPTRKAFTTGTQGQQINAINTALGHISQITTLADQLENGGFTPANKAFNTISTLFGSAKVTNFDTLKDALAGEVSSVLAKGGATVSGIQEAKEKINASNSPTQLAGYVKTLIPVMGSKLAELNFQYHQAMGENDPFSALSPESRQTLTRLGFDPDKPQIGQQQTAPQQVREGATQPIPGIPNSEATFKGGKWVRTK